MQLEALQYFIAVVDAGSFRQAAENIHISQSALSRQVDNLEKSVGAQLLSRLARGVELTEAGRIFLYTARTIHASLTLAHDEITALEGLNKGKIRLASVEPFAEQLLAELISSFQKTYPEIQFDVRVGTSRRVIELINQGVAEIGIAYNAAHDPALKLLALLEQPLVAFLSSEHPLAHQPALSIAHLAGFPLALAPARSQSRQLVDAAARQAGIQLTVSVESDSVALRLAMARKPPLATIAAAIAGLPEVKNGNLLCRPLLDEALQKNNIAIVSVKGRIRSKAVVNFERHLYRTFRGSNPS
ncbi:LysR family transcriptional regulator [Pseudochelatococcus lubricantis]|uniref:LysR family transcriptional regulator n=1 Tax=Pseudochelatococcus lubricantis TaxID=1538102 RepID=UPI0035E98747